ncbi:hypothetical protein A5821_002500 [Enterococcus sp. 7F3_DIV0205]|uniref:LXG domain-containing protein n=1 Tax=Candidatus Enterococcus palustris TaxID=1834189 RepID=A0AAQ3W9V6_9ENTE|nr:hypothetical protein [Enterococcus sp. 7F3_DIV0205]OTN82931.1 hypothetical protein A5821_002854 [Enterococcus sp. 7F3_DIV0205]
MGLKFYVSEAQSRSIQASQLSNQANQAINSLQSSIQLFLSAPLSSKAYDSAKSYFMVAYTPLCQSAIMTGEALESAHKKFLSEYQGTVSGIDTDEDLILEEINQFEQLKQRLDHQMSTAKTPRPDLERRYINACESIDKRREKLEKFHAYDGQSASFFSDYEASQQEFNAGLAQVKECKAWNPASGTFDLGRLNMSWAKPINDRWKAREKALESKRAAEIKAAKELLNGYDVMRLKNGNGYEYMILKGSKYLNPKDFPELYAAINTCGDSLPANRFIEMTVKKGIVDPSIAIPGLGGLGNIKNVVKGIGTAILSAGVLTALNNAPSISFSDANTDEVEIEIPKDVQRKIKKLSPEQKKALDNALDKLSKGDKTGLHDHALSGNRKGERAFDIKGKGTGNNRGGIRGTYETDGKGKIRLKDVIRGHKY